MVPRQVEIGSVGKRSARSGGRSGGGEAPGRARAVGVSPMIKEAAMPEQLQRKSVKPGQPGAAPGADLNKQVESVQQGMQKVNDASKERRMDLLQTTEALTRETISVEVEILRYQHQEAELERNLSEMESRRDQVKRNIDDLSKKVESVKAEVDKCEKDCAKVRGDVERLRKLRENYQSELAKYRHDKSELVRE